MNVPEKKEAAREKLENKSRQKKTAIPMVGGNENGRRVAGWWRCTRGRAQKGKGAAEHSWTGRGERFSGFMGL